MMRPETLEQHHLLSAEYTLQPVGPKPGVGSQRRDLSREAQGCPVCILRDGDKADLAPLAPCTKPVYLAQVRLPVGAEPLGQLWSCFQKVGQVIGCKPKFVPEPSVQIAGIGCHRQERLNPFRLLVDARTRAPACIGVRIQSATKARAAGSIAAEAQEVFCVRARAGVGHVDMKLFKSFSDSLKLSLCISIASRPSGRPKKLATNHDVVDTLSALGQPIVGCKYLEGIYFVISSLLEKSKNRICWKVPLWILSAGCYQVFQYHHARLVLHDVLHGCKEAVGIWAVCASIGDVNVGLHLWHRHPPSGHEAIAAAVSANHAAKQAFWSGVCL